jgi:hypothetical protein
MSDSTERCAEAAQLARHAARVVSSAERFAGVSEVFVGCAGGSVARRQLIYRVGDPVHALAEELEGAAGEFAACSLALLGFSAEHRGHDGSDWLVLLATDLGNDLATAACADGAPGRVARSASGHSDAGARSGIRRGS